jgi:predicted metal-dependent peptidase
VDYPFTDLESFEETFREIKKEKNEAELKRQRIERFSQFFGRVNSALTLRKVTVKVEHSSISAPAWSGSREVVFNSRLLGDLKTPKEIAGLRGLDLHEVSHILYTAREGSDLFDWVRENNLFSAYNALEDQRIETLFTTRYPSTIDWFTSTILIHFVDNADAFTNSYPLLRGRKYLPKELRARSRNAYPDQNQIDEICDIVDQYRLLVFPNDSEQAKDLIKRFDALLPRQEVPNGAGDIADWEKELLGNPSTKVIVKINDPFGHGDRPHEGIESSTSRPVSPIQQKRDRDRAKNAPANDDQQLAEKLKNKSASQSTIEIDLTGDDADNSSDQGGKDAGNSEGEMIAGVLDEMLNDILNSTELAKEINDIIRQIGGLPSLSTNNSKEPQLDRFQSATPDANTFQASLSFSRELERLQATFDPAWDKYQAQGRLQAHRYLRGDDLETIFDQWSEGKDDATEIECVIILDNSGSMSGNKATNAYKSMYAIKRALDRINANTTVITFNNATKTLYRASDRANNTIRDAGAGGGTEPDQAIAYATKILAETEKPVRIFFAITDGEWSGDQTVNHDAIRKMANAGVLTAFAYIPEKHEQVSLTQENTHFCEIASIVRNPLDLIGMAKSIVKYAVNRRLVSN